MVRKHWPVLLLALAPVFGADWIRVASPHFELYTDTGETSARRVLTRFEQAREILSTSAGWREPGRPNMLILLFGSERDFAGLRPVGTVRGFYQSGPERDYIAMLSGAGLDRVILHEYTHSVLNHAAAPLPQWFEEGLAELYSTLEVGRGGARAGGPIAEHVAALERSRWFGGEELGRIGKDSPHYNEAGRIGVFYAQSWALTHMLTFAKGYRERLPEFVELLNAGEESGAAFQKAFSKDLDAAMRDLQGYARSGFGGVTIDAPRNADLVFSAAERLEPALAWQPRAEILLLMGRHEEARRIYERAAKEYPRSPAARTGLAVLAVKDRDYARARELFESAIALGARDGSTLFEYAMLLRDTGAPPELVHEYLEKTVAANPSHAEAHFLLGIRASDAGRFSHAVTHLSRAVELLPRQAYFQQALALAYYRLDRPAEARTAALRALRAARNEHEEQMARGALQMIEAGKPDTPARKPAVTTPAAWNPPKGDASFSGDLIRVECSGRSARLHVRSEAETRVLLVDDPRSVAIRGGGPERTLSCGAQPRTPVVVEFTSEGRRVTAVEFR